MELTVEHNNKLNYIDVIIYCIVKVVQGFAVERFIFLSIF